MATVEMEKHHTTALNFQENPSRLAVKFIFLMLHA